MQRFHPTTGSKTLSHKANGDADGNFPKTAAISGRRFRVAKILGMDPETRARLDHLLMLARTRRTAVAGRFMPDRGVSAILAEAGIAENVEEADFFRFSRVATPYTGICAKLRQSWEEAGHRLEDLTSPRVRRAQISLGLLKLEGAQAIVIGRHDDAETLAIAGTQSGTRIIEDTTDTARLHFSPAYGVVSHTHHSPRKVAWLVQQLRLRYRDARVTFLDTISPAMAAREEALERLLVECTTAVIVGDPDETSCQALAETAMRRGKSSLLVATPSDLDRVSIAVDDKIALTAGAFATDAAIRAVAERLAEK